MPEEMKHRGGCLCCPQTEDILQMDTVLYNGFGGYSVNRNGKLFYQGDSNEDFDNFKTLQQIEAEAQRTPEDKWEVILNNPLRGATWERGISGHWILTKTNQGFA
jgi:hypothetical protein